MRRILLLMVMSLWFLNVAQGQNGAPLYATGAGNFQGGEWNPSDPAEFEYDDLEGVYRLEVDNMTVLTISTCKSDIPNDWTKFDECAYDCGVQGYGTTPGVEKTLYAVSGNPKTNIIAPWKGDYKITVAGDLSTITLWTEPLPIPGLVDPLYLFGDMNDWTFEESWAMETMDGEHNIYRFVCSDGQLVTSEDYFQISDVDILTNIGGDGEPFEMDVETPVWRNTNQGNINLAEDWNGVVWLKIEDNWTDGRMIFSNDKTFVPSWYSDIVSAGIATASPVRYFTLQGVPVEKPAHGVYIEIREGRARKVAL